MFKRLNVIVLVMILQASLWGQPKIIAHRGASAEAPENTLSAFTNAIPIGVEAIEFDVHLTYDEVPIIIHDFVMGRTTNGGYLKRSTELTVEEIRLLDAGSWFNKKFSGEKIPLLKEVLEFAKGKARLMVEIKKDNSPPDQIAKIVVSYLNLTPGDYLVGSFCPLIISEVLKASSEYPVIGILEEPDMIDIWLKTGIRHLAIWYALLTPLIVQQLHEEGVEVWTFTVDNPGLAKYLDSIGVDGIISNNPRLLKSTL